MKNFVTAAVLVSALILVASNAATAQRLRIATEGYYPPFNFIDDRGELAGFDVDIARVLCARLRVECEIVAQAWSDMIPGLIAGEYDAIVASMSITEQRQRQVAFSIPYYSNMLAFVGPKSRAGDPRSLNFAGLTVAAQQDTISAQYLSEQLAGEVEVMLYPTQEAAYGSLREGRVDLVLADIYPSYNWLRTKAGSGYQFVGEFVDIDDKIGIALRKEDVDLRERFNDALAEILMDGTYQEINERYFPFSIYF